MNKKYLPDSDGPLLMWAENFSALVSATPAIYGISGIDASALEGSVTNFTTALDISEDPQSRTRGAIVNRNLARATLKALIRRLAKGIQSRRADVGGTITAAQLVSLGLPIYAPNQGRSSHATPVPDAPPAVHVTAMQPLRHTIRLCNPANLTRRARPATAAGAILFAYIPPDARRNYTPPADLTNYRFAGIATREKADITYTHADAGRTATIVARYFTKRGTLGPAGPPAQAMIAG